MKAFDRAIERFCYKHPKFGIPRLMMIVIAGQAIMYVLGLIDPTGALSSLIAFDAEAVLHGQVWRLVTFIFYPVYGSILSTVLSLYFYYFVGSALEAQWGTGRFTIYYLMGMALNVVYGFVTYFIGFGDFITANYINLSLFFAFATMWPDFSVYLFFIIPVKMKWLAFIDAAFFIMEMILGKTLVPLIAILNFLLFFGYILWERIFGIRKVRERSAQFRRAANNVRVNLHRGENAAYRHKCAVCGRTDVSNPELEFRYCSRCVGYHCFCAEHINNHVHFTE